MQALQGDRPRELEVLATKHLAHGPATDRGADPIAADAFAGGPPGVEGRRGSHADHAGQQLSAGTTLVDVVLDLQPRRLHERGVHERLRELIVEARREHARSYTQAAIARPGRSCARARWSQSVGGEAGPSLRRGLCRRSARAQAEGVGAEVVAGVAIRDLVLGVDVDVDIAAALEVGGAADELALAGLQQLGGDTSTAPSGTGLVSDGAEAATAPAWRWHDSIQPLALSVGATFSRCGTQRRSRHAVSPLASWPSLLTPVVASVLALPRSLVPSVGQT